LSNTCTSKLDHGFANLQAGKKTQHWKIIYKEIYRYFNFHHQVEVTHTFTHPSSLSLKIWNALGASESGSTCVIGSVESILPDCTSGSNVGLDKENHYTVRYWILKSDATCNSLIINTKDMTSWGMNVLDNLHFFECSTSLLKHCCAYQYFWTGVCPAAIVSPFSIMAPTLKWLQQTYPQTWNNR
jgi:hypothetical protein